MANIQNYLNQIKTAVFGKDVRESIHDAIKQCYDDASIDHDNANMEVKLARGSHDTLNERFTSVEENIKNNSEQLEHIANKGTTVEVLERVTKEEINRQIEDGTIANLTIEDNSITWDKFKNELKSNINQLVKNTTINNDGSVKEIFTDNKYKITTFENNVVNEKWYTSDNNLLFTKTTTLNPDGSFSESLF